jgi:hypothetical protein
MRTLSPSFAIAISPAVICTRRFVQFSSLFFFTSLFKRVIFSPNSVAEQEDDQITVIRNESCCQQQQEQRDMKSLQARRVSESELA